MFAALTLRYLEKKMYDQSKKSSMMVCKLMCFDNESKKITKMYALGQSEI